MRKTIAYARKMRSQPRQAKSPPHCAAGSTESKVSTTTTDGTPPRWYSVNNMGMATLCADQADAEMTASDCDTEWPRQAPHRAVQLVEVSALDTERTARIEAQQRLADMQELAAKAGLAHMKAVADAVAEEVAAELEACEERVVSLFEVLETPYLPDITRAIRARGTP